MAGDLARVLAAAALAPLPRWVALAAIVLVAVLVVRAAVGCALRLIGLALLAVAAWLVWSYLT
jgi:hypothetical protein